MPSRLNPEDQQRVNEYLNAPQRRLERRPFRLWRMVLVLLIVVSGLGLLSLLLGRLAL